MKYHHNLTAAFLALVASAILSFIDNFVAPVAEEAGLFSAPLWVALLTVLLFRQPLGLLDSFAVILGFIGALMLLQPDFADLSILSLMPLAVGFFYGLGMMLTRHWCSDETPVALALGIFLAIGFAGFIMLGVVTIWPGNDFISMPWVVPNERFLWLSLFHAIGVWAFLLWGTTTNLLIWAGVAIILISGFIMAFT